MNRIVNIVAGIVTLLAIGTPAAAEPITYQGSLTDAGAPADGEYDFRFRLYTAEVGGVQVGPQTGAENLMVTDGVFQLDLDFGDVFDGSALWLEIDMRPGASGGVFTVLTPRQAIRSAPQAIHARTAETVLDAPWVQDGDGLVHGGGTDAVFINRNTGITGAEYFGVHSTVPGFVGMYISGPSGAIPFYGYSVDGAISAYTRYSNQNWSLYKDGATRLAVNSDNDLVVSNEVIARDFLYTVPKTRYLSVSGNVFTSHFDYFANGGQGGAYLSSPGAGWVSAAVNLPHGAVVSRVVAYCQDDVPGDMLVSLQYLAHGGTGYFTMGSVTTAGVAGSLTLTDSTITSEVIDNAGRHYFLRVYSTSWPGNFQMRIKSVVIEYTVTQAD